MIHGSKDRCPTIRRSGNEPLWYPFSLVWLEDKSRFL